MTEGTPAPTWEPGEPLYAHPHTRVSGDGNYVRELFQEMCDEEHAVRVFLNSSPIWQVKCIECLVGWSPDEGPRCWVCGKPAANYEVANDVSQHMQRVETTVALRGGPRDGDCIELESPRHTEAIVVPLIDLATSYVAESSAAPESLIRTGRYVRSYFNYPTRYWVYTFKENA